MDLPDLPSEIIGLSESRRRDRDANRGKPCPYCAQIMSRARPPTHDHVHPRSLGGSDGEDNILVVCRQCNGDKGCMTLGEFYGFLLQGGDERASVVGVLIEDAADFDKYLGAQLYADAGVTIARRKRRANRKRNTVIPLEVAVLLVDEPVATEDQLERERIVLNVVNKLHIPREHWSLADRAKQVVVLIGGQTVRTRVTTAEKLEDAIVVARLRIERDRIDARPKIYIPRMFISVGSDAGAAA